MRYILILITLILGGCNQSENSIRLATYTYADNDRLENLKLLSNELEYKLKRKISLKSYPDVKSFIEGILANEVDIALINTLGYLILAEKDNLMFPIANMQIKDDVIDNYKTVILTNKQNLEEYTQITEKADSLRMMFVSEGSTSGNLVPRLFLSANKISSPESKFKLVKYGGNHTTTFKKLVSGETDLCAIGSNEYFKQINMDTSLKNTIKLLWVSNEIPLGPVLVNKELSNKEKEIISNLFLNLHKENVEIFNSVKSGWSEASQSDKFQSITDQYYDSFRQVNGNKTDLKKVLELFNN